MISLEQAQAMIMAEVRVAAETETLPLLQAQGRILAEPVRADFDVPPQDCSAMDGFAVLAGDIEQANPECPVSLRLVGEVAAGGRSEEKLWEAEAIQVMTGAPLPEGAQVVVPVEDSSLDGDRLSIRRSLPAGTNIRRRGEDIRRGQTVLEKGARLGPVQIGLLASLGRDRVRVSRRPQVAILATGDELLEPGSPHRPGRIYSSNHYALAAQVRRAGGEPLLLGIAPTSGIS